jgi:hypothetical protein
LEGAGGGAVVPLALLPAAGVLEGPIWAQSGSSGQIWVRAGLVAGLGLALLQVAHGVGSPLLLAYQHGFVVGGPAVF